MNSANNRIAIVTHGGAGGSRDCEDGCRAASAAAFAALHSGAGAIEAAAAAVVVLEDDGRFNAGSGSVLSVSWTEYTSPLFTRSTRC